MVRFIAALVVTLGFVGMARAEDGKVIRVVSCTTHDVATRADGTKVGMCITKTGKVTYLRSFQLVRLADPKTGAPVLAMVGVQ